MQSYRDFLARKARVFQGDGITPDIAVRPLKVAKPEGSDFDPIKESDLRGSLQNEKQKLQADKDAEEARRKLDEEEQKLAETDYTLYEALNLLKGLTIASQRVADGR